MLGSLVVHPDYQREGITVCREILNLGMKQKFPIIFQFIDGKAELLSTISGDNSVCGCV